MDARQEDEVGRLATLYYVSRGARACDVIDRHIEFAEEKGQWTEVSKWHRVKLRIRRMAGAAKASHLLVERLGEIRASPGSPAPYRNPAPSLR